MELAVCKFCGQTIAEEYETREQAIEEGTLACSCAQARAYQQLRERAQAAKLELRDMLLKDDEVHNVKAVEQVIFDILVSAVDLIAEDKIYKITLGLSSGGTVDIKAGSGGKISLKRSVALTNKREV